MALFEEKVGFSASFSLKPANPRPSIPLPNTPNNTGSLSVCLDRNQVSVVWQYHNAHVLRTLEGFEHFTHYELVETLYREYFFAQISVVAGFSGASTWTNTNRSFERLQRSGGFAFVICIVVPCRARNVYDVEPQRLADPLSGRPRILRCQ
jgi:hypothetical protein